MGETSPRVLYVDDDRDICTVVEIALSLGGFDVRVCHSGSSCLQTAQQWPPDLLLLDVVLPDLDGAEVIRRLKASGPRPFAIAFVTALSDPRRTQALMELGALSVIRKPLDLNTFPDDLRQLLAQSAGQATAATTSEDPSKAGC